jgi:hippurate hydrolase
MMKDKITRLSDEAFDYVCSVYKHLHQMPELAFQEVKTAAYIQAQLADMNIPFRSGIGTTGILGILSGKHPSKKTIALRADMDALPIDEETDLPYKSKVPHCMHACGHDSHVASLLGVAKVLSALKDEWEGTVLLVFQPGEERHPGGARLLLKDGVFRDYTPELILAQHASVDYPVGTVAFREGQVMASSDEIHITVKGKGGHGALPHLFNDTVLAASQLIVSLQQVRARLSHPFTPMVLSFGKFIADGSTNIIPDEVKLSGTLRTLNEQWRHEAKEHIRTIAAQTVAAYGCTCEVDAQDGYPSVYNDEEITCDAITFATDLLGKEKVGELEVRMTGEDFGFFTQKYPCTFYRFGIKSNLNENAGGLHTSTFRIDLEAFRTSVKVMAWLAYSFVNGTK